MKKFLVAALALFSLGGCAGYRIGPVQPYYLRSVHNAVPTFGNKTLLPRIAVLVTDSVIKQFQQDGTYRIAGDDQADATLKGDITRITAPGVRCAQMLATPNSPDAGALFARRTQDRCAGRTSGNGSTTASSDPTSPRMSARLPLAAEEPAASSASWLVGVKGEENLWRIHRIAERLCVTVSLRQSGLGESLN